MSEKTREKRGLGRGLSALMADIEPVRPTEQAKAGGDLDQIVPIERVVPNPDQPRRDFEQTELEELAASISEHGIIQPLIVRKQTGDGGRFEIVAGERRWRAAQIAKLHEIPVVVRQFSDAEVLEIAIIENIQRSDLNPVEEALGYKQLQDRFGHTQDQLAKQLGKSRSHVANLVRLLNLPDDVLSFVRQGKLSYGHARALITAKDPVSLAKKVIASKLSVRETERLVNSEQASKEKNRSTRKTSSNKSADTRALEQNLSAALGLKVVIDHNEGAERGTKNLSYTSFAQLDDLCRRLAQSEEY
jgi:ParB family chromosome partitioning protein